MKKDDNRAKVVARLLEEKELDRVFGGGGDGGGFTQRIDCPPCGDDGKAFYLSTE